MAEQDKPAGVADANAAEPATKRKTRPRARKTSKRKSGKKPAVKKAAKKAAASRTKYEDNAKITVLNAEHGAA